MSQPADDIIDVVAVTRVTESRPSPKSKRKPIKELPRSEVALEAEAHFDQQLRNRAPKSPMDEVAERARRLQMTRLRTLACVRYITSPDKITLRELERDPRFVDVRPSTLARWCSEDRWDERRNQFSVEWRFAARERLAHRFVRDHMEDLDRLAKIKEQALTKLEDEVLKVGKFEVLLKTTLEIMKMQSKLRDTIIDATLDTRQMPKFDDEGNLITETVAEKPQLEMEELDEEERQLAAQAILAHRAQKQLTAKVPEKE